MINILFRHIRQFFIRRPKDNTNNNSETLNEQQNISETQTQLLVNDLNSACTKLTIYIREDGEFAVTTEFTRNSEEVMDITGTVLHMINSGLLADYFLQSLQHWGTANKQDTSLIQTTIQKWKTLFDETIASNDQLAVDPSDVFALKSFNKDS